MDLKGFPRMKSEVGDRDDAGGARGQVQRGSQSRVQKQGPRSETEPLPEEPGPNRPSKGDKGDTATPWPRAPDRPVVPLSLGTEH